jgi:hypothetical protein
MKQKIVGHSFDDFKHGEKVVVKFEDCWIEGAVSIEDKEGMSWIYLCTDYHFLDGKETRERFGYKYSWAIAHNHCGYIDVPDEDVRGITHIGFLGEKVEPSLKKHWKFDSNYTADGIALTIHDIETHEMIAYAVNGDGVFAESVEEILKKKGYHTYNLKFNDRGQIC